ncbi:NAD(P)H-quinone oxidoreductase [Nocardioides sp.]|uniref:NAD(P)H-quinone oxidoreductase n=1 Tax=Nocardioides sp. TaxID=35761 RepID=UPI0039E6755D
MRAVVAREPGGPEVLEIAEAPDPVAGPGEVVIDVVAAGINRADLLQRQGHYPPPPGAPETIGLEVSGRIAMPAGPWSTGDEVCALLAGGGYATKVAVPVGQLMPVPAGVDLPTAAALPEVAGTVWSNLKMTADLQAGQTLLVHGGAGGIGSFAIQLAKALGARVIATAGSEEKLALCRELGADEAIDYHSDWAAQVKGQADVVLDNMGAKYLASNVAALADGGRLVVIGLQGGTRAELDINALMRKRAGVIGTTLRSRSIESKAEVCRQVVEHVWPLVTAGAIRPVVSAVLPLDQASQAHELMTSGAHTGKILLAV